MSDEPLVKVPYNFPGITILVPNQNENDIVAINKGSLIPEHFPLRTGNFTMIRLIGNFVLATRAEYEHGEVNPVMDFDPPVEIRVAYNLGDVMESQGDYKKLKLAYWDGSDWVVLNETEHEYQILPPSTGQIAEAKIRTWVGDPPLAWGN
ncbi:MAG: hypothetical protein WCE68_14260 [Anaerolineales bacterium]